MTSVVIPHSDGEVHTVMVNLPGAAPVRLRLCSTMTTDSTVNFG